MRKKSKLSKLSERMDNRPSSKGTQLVDPCSLAVTIRESQFRLTFSTDVCGGVRIQNRAQIHYKPREHAFFVCYAARARLRQAVTREIQQILLECYT